MIDFGMEVTEVEPSSPPPKNEYSDRQEISSSCHFDQDTCFICNNQCYPQSFSSNPSPAFALWALEIRQVLYDAFNIEVDPSFFQEFHGELPLCPQCSFKVGTLKTVQKQISDLQSSYNRIRADMAFSITEIITTGGGSKSRYEPHNSDSCSFKSDSPTELLNSFRESEVKTLQQLVYQSWHDRYMTETEEPVTSTPPAPTSSCLPPAPPALTREGSPEKFNFQMPVRKEAPKQYRNKKLEVAEQAPKNVINLGKSAQSQSPGTNNNGASAKQKTFLVPHVILPSTTIDLNPPHQQLTSDDENEEETDRLQLDDREPVLSPPHIASESPSTTNPEILTVVNGVPLPTLTLSMSPRLFCPTQSPSGFISKNEGTQLTVETNEEHDDHVAALSTNVEITEADLNEYSDEELEGEPHDDDDEVEEDEEENEVEEEEENENESEELDVGGTRELVENDECEERIKDDEPEPKSRRRRKSKLTSRKTSTDSSSCEYVDLKQNHEGLYVCKFCDKTFIHKYPYRDHLKTHTGEGPKCKLCLKIFPKKHNLMLHMRTHTGEKPYKCEVCRKGFADKSNLKVHMRVHTGERPYQCEYCNLTFVNSSRLVVHRRLHTGEKPFPCGICHRTFITSNQLASHTKNHFNGKPYKCDECGKGYSGKIGLQSHISTHHGV